MTNNTHTRYKIREGTPDEDGLFADFFYEMWMDIGIANESLQPDWRDNTLSFMTEARLEHQFKWFLAEDAEKVVCVAGGHLHNPYPDVFKKEFRLNGLIWGVYTSPDHRKNGLAKQLTLKVIDYLQSIECTRVRLHAAPMGRSLYELLGFVSTNEMELLT